MNLTLTSVLQGAVGQSQQFVFLDNDGNPVDLSGPGVTLSGNITNRGNMLRPIDGSLALGGDPSAGQVLWTYGTNDVAMNGQLMVQFHAGGSLDIYSAPGIWLVEAEGGVSTFQFTYDLTTAVGKLRLHAGDTNLNAGPFPGGFNFTDQEMQYFVTASNGNMTGAVVLCLMTLANVWSPLSVSEWVMLSQQKFDAKQVSKNFEDRARFFLENPIEEMDKGSKYGVIELLRSDAWTLDPRS